MWSKAHQTLRRSEKWFIGVIHLIWCAPTDKAKRNGFDYLFNAFSAPSDNENNNTNDSKKKPPVLLFSVPFQIARPISHNWKVEMVFICRYTQVTITCRHLKWTRCWHSYSVVTWNRSKHIENTWIPRECCWTKKKKWKLKIKAQTWTNLLRMTTKNEKVNSNSKY